MHGNMPRPHIALELIQHGKPGLIGQANIQHHRARHKLPRQLQRLRGIARNLLREEARRIAQAAEAARTLAAMYPTNRETDDALNDALSACLDRLPPDKRSLLESYYSHSGIDKIQQHARTAKQMGITLNALRNRVMRLRSELEACMRKQM